MSKEISLTANVSVVNGGYKAAFSESAQYDQAAQGAASGIQVIGTSEEDLSVGDITTNGYLIMKNLDAVNFFTYGPKVTGSMQAFGKLKAGETAILRVKDGVTVRLLADTASCKLSYIFLQN